MYCVKCGVELRDGTKSCPLCQTQVYFPEMKEAPPIYPKNLPPIEKVSRRGLLFIMTFVFIIAAAVMLITDINVVDGVHWADIAIAGLALAYVIIFLPMWFRYPTPTVFLPSDFAAVAVYLWFLNFHFGGDWFFSFALPICACSAVIISAAVILTYYLRRGRLYIFGGAAIAAAGFSIFIEYLVNVNFGGQKTLFWSFYPCAILFLGGIMLIIIAMVKPFKESLKKLFSI